MLFYCEEYLSVQDYKEIINLNSEKILIKMMNKHQILIKGKQLRIIYYSKEELKIIGRIEEVFFND